MAATLFACVAMPGRGVTAPSTRAGSASSEIQLLKSEADLRAATTRIREVEGRLARLDADEIAASLQADERRGRMTLRVRAMYRMRHRGFLPLLFSADSPHELLRSARYMWWIVRADEAGLTQWRREIEEMGARTTALAVERRELLTAAGQAATLRAEAMGLRGVDDPAAGDVTRSPSTVARAVVSRPRPEPVWLSPEERAAIPVQKREIEGAPAGAPDVALDLSIEGPPAMATEELRPTAPFERARGLLPMPATGDIERSGRGVAILAKDGDPIRAVAAGEVSRLLWIRGFGNVCILDHGGGWHSVYGHAASFGVAEGDWVDSGRVIGAVGATGSLDGPRLYFEVRQDRGALDPLDWLKVPPGLARPRAL